MLMAENYMAENYGKAAQLILPDKKNQYTIMLSAKSPISSELPKISLPKSRIIWYFAYILLIIDFSISKGF